MLDLEQLTLESAIKKGIQIFKDNKIDNAKIEIYLLAEKCFEVERHEIFLKGNTIVDKEKTDSFFHNVERRINGEPIQYILGEWSFMGFDFKVGSGVLIPRPETELLAEYVLEVLRGKQNPVIFDLCSGSGCIGISIGRLIKGSEVYCFEKYDGAFEYLTKNIRYNNVSNVYAVKCDILHGAADFHVKPDVIVSNPPYIPAGDIESLQNEVKLEPWTALDGGDDGMIFYRTIAEKWLSLLKNGGIAAVECGIGQAGDISKIFEHSGLSEVGIIKDYNDIDRIVKGVYYCNA